MYLRRTVRSSVKVLIENLNRLSRKQFVLQEEAVHYRTSEDVGHSGEHMPCKSNSRSYQIRHGRPI